MRYKLVLSSFIILSFASIYCMEKPDDFKKRKNDEPELFENFIEEEELEDIDFIKIHEIMDSIMLDITVNNTGADYSEPIRKLYVLKDCLDSIEKKAGREKLKKIYDEIDEFIVNASVIFIGFHGNAGTKQ